jgi:hypothetical protein
MHRLAMRFRKQAINLLAAVLKRNMTVLELLEQEQAAARARIAALEAKIGPGRGHGPRSRQRHFPAIDVYSQVAPRGDEAFEEWAGLTKLQFDRLVLELAPAVRRNRRVRHGVPEPSGRQRSTKSTLQNRILMTMKWLSVGGSCTSLGLDFGLFEHVVSEDIMHVIYAIVECLQYEVQWPNEEQINELIGTYGPLFPDVIGVIDNTFTGTLRKNGDWSGHRKQFLRSHLVVADAFGFILHVIAGQPGGRHDHHDYQLSSVPALLADAGVRLLGDDAFQGLESVIPPATRASMPDRDERIEFNIDHTSKRSRIEQFFSVLKQWFPMCGRKWTRVDRKFLAVVFVACCLLYNRRKRLNL